MYNNIIENMADIYGYMYADSTTGERKIKLRADDLSVKCGSRFKYLANEVPADYNSLVKALNEAIDKEAETKGQQYVTNEKSVFNVQELDFDTVKNTFDTLITQIIQSHDEKEFEEVWSPKIVQITERYLGKGKKASQCTRDQVEQLNLIVLDLQELVK